MPTLADLNRQKRDYAASGMAQEGDIPYLYELYANGAPPPPPGIGGDAGGMAEGSAAPNPTGTGGGLGGASGAADVGLAGPGITGLGANVDSLYREYVAATEGGQAGEPGGPGGGFGGYGGPQVVNTSGPLGFAGFLGDIGLFGDDPYLADIAESMIPGMSTGATIGRGLRQLAGGPYGVVTPGPHYRPNVGTPQWYDLMSALEEAQRLNEGYNPNAVNDVTGVDFESFVTGGTPTSGSSWAGGLDEGGGINDVTGVDFGAFGPSQPSDTSWAGGLDDRGGAAGESSGGAGAGGGGGGGGGAQNANDILHEGGYISEDEVPGEYRADVPKTLQEGEGVLTADAMEVLGPGFVHGVNMMAKMMRGGM